MGLYTCEDGEVPIREKEWGLEEVDPLAADHLECVKGEYSAWRFEEAVNLGSRLVGKVGDFYLAVRHAQELKMGELNDTRARLGRNDYLFPVLPDASHEALRLGVIPPFDEIVTAELRQKGLPHEKNHTQMAAEALWSDVKYGCMMICRTRVIREGGRIEPTPTGMAVKKTPDRALSAKMRMISDIGRINLATSAKRMYSMMVPATQGICEKIERLRRALPKVPIGMDKRDISRAFKWIRLRPYMASVLMREFEKAASSTSPDFYAAFLVLPFGFVGYPGYFCMLTDIIQALRRSFSPSGKTWRSDFHYEAEMFAGDAMFIEPKLGARLSERVGSWGWAFVFLLGADSLNFTKMDIEGTRQSKKTMIGYELDTEAFAISLPKAK